MNWEKIPLELRQRKQWLAWYYSEEGTKTPIGASDDPSTWTTFDSLPEARRAFVLSADDPYTGVDFDNCIDSEGVIADKVQKILECFRGIAYAEISPSGTGVKLTTKAAKPAGSRCQEGAWLECYDNRRFWAMTGNCLPGFETIGDGQEAIDWLCRTYLAQAKEQKESFAVRTISTSLEKRAQAYVEAADLPQEGGRNNCAFRLAGHLRAIIGEHGDRLSESDIASFLKQWNHRLPNPLSEKEVLAVASSSMKNGTPREEKPASVEVVQLCNIDWDNLNRQVEDEEIDDEDFCKSLVPACGLVRKIYEFYERKAFRHSFVMGLATSISLCEMLFGRRVRSQTNMRTNDYNLIVATTGAGKEACESTITEILDAAKVAEKFMLPPDVQSGNGLMKAISANPCSIWVCDEFGKILQAVLDKKGNQHIKNIGNHLLKLYGKSAGSYGGAAHSDGIRNRVIQPHLCVLGLSTGSSLFETVSTEQVSDGLIGRIAFWPVQDRPEPRYDARICTPSEDLVEVVKQWTDWTPHTGSGEKPTTEPHTPKPETIAMSDGAFSRWIKHSKDIDERMRRETELRAAIWSRVAARTQKLALIHRCARIEVDPRQCNWDFVQIEIEDIQWGVTLSNWLARNACCMIGENVYDKSGNKAKAILAKALEHGDVSKRELLRKFRSLTAGDLEAAADELKVQIINQSTGGRPKTIYRATHTTNSN